MLQQLPPHPPQIETVQYNPSTAKSLLDSPSLKRLTRTEPNTGKHQTIFVIEGKVPSILMAEEEIKKWLIDLGDLSASLDKRQEQLALSLTKLDRDSGEILSNIDSRINGVEGLTSLIDAEQREMRSRFDEYDDHFVALFDSEEQTKSRLTAIQQVTAEKLSALEEKLSAVISAQKSARTPSPEEHNTTTPSLRSPETTEYAAAQTKIIERLNVLENQFTRLESLEKLLNTEKTTKDSQKKAKVQQIANLQRRVTLLTWLGGGSIVSFILAWAWWIYVYKK